MKIRKLYIKILLCFVGILVVTEILIFGFFVLFAGRTFRDRFEQYTAAKIILAKEAVEERIQSQPERPPAENYALRAFVHHLGELYDAKVWLEGREGEVYAKSFDGDIPRNLEKRLGVHARAFKDFRLSHSFGRHGVFYAVAPVKVEGREVGSLHILFEAVAGDHPEGAFGLGLLIIGLVVALLIIPVSRLITRPVKSLNRSALRIAKGDLAHRADIKGSDEIGDLGRSFNEMAERLAGMIKGSRELTANVSHELRSPLARMRLAETLIRERIERGEYGNIEKHLDAIREDIEQLDRLIGRTLALSKLDIRETPLKREPLDLSQMIEAMLDRLSPLMAQKDLRLKSALSPGIRLSRRQGSHEYRAFQPARQRHQVLAGRGADRCSSPFREGRDPYKRLEHVPGDPQGRLEKYLRAVLSKERPQSGGLRTGTGHFKENHRKTRRPHRGVKFRRGVYGPDKPSVWLIGSIMTNPGCLGLTDFKKSSGPVIRHPRRVPVPPR